MSDFNIALAQEFVESDDPFPVDFDLAWQWLGYSRKDAAKRAFDKAGFSESYDYSLFHKKVENSLGGRPMEIIMLSVECLKMWAMMSGTEQGKMVRRYFLECEKIAKEKVRNPLGSYTERVQLMYNSSSIPPGYWSILQESAYILLWVETVLKCPVDKADLLDGSIGIRWANYRKDKEWAGDRVSYSYTFPDGRKISPWCYRMEELYHFRMFMEEYKQKYLISYLESKGYTQILVKQSYEIKNFLGKDVKYQKEGFQIKMFE